MLALRDPQDLHDAPDDPQRLRLRLPPPVRLFTVSLAIASEAARPFSSVAVGAYVDPDVAISANLPSKNYNCPS
jgi:hypothetical protein